MFYGSFYVLKNKSEMLQPRKVWPAFPTQGWRSGIEVLLTADLGSVMMNKPAWGRDSVSNTGDLTSSPDSSLLCFLLLGFSVPPNQP